MKETCVVLLLCLAFCSYPGHADPDSADGTGTEAACGNYNLKKGCVRIFDPVCGTDNVLYNNECLLCVQNLQRNTNVRIKKRGMCQEPSPRSGFTEN